MISLRTDAASSYPISGSGLANANTTGFLGMDAIISLVTTFPTLNPKNTSADFIASTKVILSDLIANGFLSAPKSVLP